MSPFPSPEASPNGATPAGRRGVADGLWVFPEPSFAAGLSENIETKAFSEIYADAKSFLQSLKATGARGSPPGHRPASPVALRHLLAAHAGPFRTTFRIAFLTLDAAPSEVEQ